MIASGRQIFRLEFRFEYKVVVVVVFFFLCRSRGRNSSLSTFELHAEIKKVLKLALFCKYIKYCPIKSWFLKLP